MCIKFINKNFPCALFGYQTWLETREYGGRSPTNAGDVTIWSNGIPHLVSSFI